MAFDYKNKIPSRDEILAEFPLPENLRKIKQQRDLEIRSIFEGKDSRFILIIGPCSADNEDSVCEYMGRLGKLQEKVREKIMIIPRIYTNKPRTTGEGYKGLLHQPDPNEKPNIVKGIKAIRRMHIRAINESHLTAADEMLYPANNPFAEDLISYVAVGARSVENQQHRLTASGLDIPVGMKNPTSGDFNVMLNSVKAAQLAHSFIYSGWEVETSGNALAHCILRGAVNQHGDNIPNYHFEDLIDLAKLYEKRNLANSSILVDCNHSNSGKKFEQQPRIAREVLTSLRHSPLLKKMVKGLMIESYLVEGTQDITEGTYGKSITDPCLNWTDSEKLVLEIADTVSNL